MCCWFDQVKKESRSKIGEIFDKKVFRQDYRTTELGIYTLHTKLARTHARRHRQTQSATSQVYRNLELAPSTFVRRPKRTSTPHANQPPEPYSPASDQPSRSLTLADADHALGIFSLCLAFRVHDAVDGAANA